MLVARRFVAHSAGRERHLRSLSAARRRQQVELFSMQARVDVPHRLARLLLRDLRSLLARFREPDGDRLFSVLGLSPFAAFLRPLFCLTDGTRTSFCAVVFFLAMNLSPD